MEERPDQYRKGRGAQINPPNPYHNLRYDEIPDPEKELRTEYIEVHPKSILNKVTSPDIPGDYSMNPYQGCEHGCVYCYARNTHPYWGYSAGLDFEQKVLIKKNAAELLEAEIRKKTWNATPILLAGNTDIYQPAERQYRITRAILEVLWRYKHPAGLITKNSLVLRDLDILAPMAEQRLVHVSISLTTLNEDLRRMLEPRTSSVAQRLKAVESLSAAGVPVNVMLSPIIPGLTDHEILPMAKAAADHGALSFGHSVVRLNGDVAAIFEDWIRKNMPDRADRVLNRIRDCHGGNLNESRFGKRMRGEGEIANVIHNQAKLAKKQYFAGKEWPEYNLELHEQAKNPQLRLF